MLYTLNINEYFSFGIYSKEPLFLYKVDPFILHLALFFLFLVLWIHMMDVFNDDETVQVFIFLLLRGKCIYLRIARHLMCVFVHNLGVLIY